MTYDRTYTWSKEFYDEMEQSIKNTEFKIEEKQEFHTVADIKLPTERKIKIEIQKFLHQFNLMNYGEEFAKIATLKTENPTELITVNSWCLDAHIMGIEVQYKNLDDKKLNLLKQRFAKHFWHYKIVWTDQTDTQLR